VTLVHLNLTCPCGDSWTITAPDIVCQVLAMRWDEWHGGHLKTKHERTDDERQHIGSALVWEGSFVRWLGPRPQGDGSWYAEILIDGNSGPSEVNERCFRRQQEQEAK
jgi:hypothetical protein